MDSSISALGRTLLKPRGRSLDNYNSLPIPTIFLFTSVGYSEGLFLTLTLLSWLLYLRGRHLFASIAASGASLTRSLGILITVPFIIEGFIRKDIFKILVYTLPMFSQAAWFYYGYLRTGNILVFFRSAEVLGE